MKPPINYYGGKTRIAPWIVSLMPPHDAYVEPFCGAASVLFAKRPVAHEVVNDIDGHLVTFLRVLRDRPDDLVRVCRLTPYARDEFAACDDRDVEDDVERARRTWVRIVQAFSGATSDSHRSSWSASIRNGGSDAWAVQRMVDRMHEAAERLRGVIIDNRPAIEAIELYGRRSDVLMYIDPPYLASTRRRTQSSRRFRANDYLHDMSTEEQHRELAAALAATPATVMLSGYHSPLYDELYEGWSVSERQVTASAGNRRGQPTIRATEVLWCNRPLMTQLRLEAGGGGGRVDERLAA
jgi:DNA adenine methylase